MMETNFRMDETWKDLPKMDVISKISESPVQKQLREHKEKIEKDRKEANEKANKPKLFLLKSYLSILGFFRTLKYKKNHTYHGGRNNRDAIYMGKNTFYEQITTSVPGFAYFNNKSIKYKYWELGYFKWYKTNAQIETNDKNITKVF